MPRKLPGLTPDQHRELSEKFKQMRDDSEYLLETLGVHYGWTAKETKLAGKFRKIYIDLAYLLENRAHKEMRGTDKNEIMSLY